MTTQDFLNAQVIGWCINGTGSLSFRLTRNNKKIQFILYRKRLKHPRQTLSLVRTNLGLSHIMRNISLNDQIKLCSDYLKLSVQLSSSVSKYINY